MGYKGSERYVSFHAGLGLCMQAVCGCLSVGDGDFEVCLLPQ